MHLSQKRLEIERNGQKFRITHIVHNSKILFFLIFSLISEKPWDFGLHALSAITTQNFQAFNIYVYVGGLFRLWRIMFIQHVTTFKSVTQSSILLFSVFNYWMNYVRVNAKRYDRTHYILQYYILIMFCTGQRKKMSKCQNFKELLCLR